MPPVIGLRGIVIAVLVLALAGAVWGLKHQTERVGELAIEKAGLETALTAASDAYADLGAWSLAKDEAAARALSAARAARAKTAAITKGIDHAPDSACPVLDAALDGLRREYPDDPGAAAAQAGPGGGADGRDPGPGNPRP